MYNKNNVCTLLLVCATSCYATSMASSAATNPTQTQDRLYAYVAGGVGTASIAAILGRWCWNTYRRPNTQEALEKKFNGLITAETATLTDQVINEAAARYVTKQDAKRMDDKWSEIQENFPHNIRQIGVDPTTWDQLGGKRKFDEKSAHLIYRSRESVINTIRDSSDFNSLKRETSEDKRRCLLKKDPSLSFDDNNNRFCVQAQSVNALIRNCIIHGTTTPAVMKQTPSNLSPFQCEHMESYQLERIVKAIREKRQENSRYEDLSTASNQKRPFLESIHMIKPFEAARKSLEKREALKKGSFFDKVKAFCMW